eukprot:gene18200-20016_t
MSCGRSTAKTLMLFGNALFLLAGLGLLGVGGYIRYASKDYDSILGKDGLATPANLLIAVGAAVFLVAFVGCIGAIKESKCFLIMYIIFVVLVLLLEIAAVVVAFYFREKAESYITDSIIKAVQQTYGEPGQETVTDAVDEIQKRLKCCGARSLSDWKTSKWAKKTNATIPGSCMYNSSTAIYQKSCIEAMKEWASKNLVLLGGIGSAVLLIEILGIWFAVVLMKRTDPVGAV